MATLQITFQINGLTKASLPTNNKEITTPNKTKDVGATIGRPENTESKTAHPQKGKSVSYWNDVISNLKQQGKVMLYTNLINTSAQEINDLTLGIEFPNGLTPFGKTVIEKPENMQELVKQVSIFAGKEMRIKLIDSKTSPNIDLSKPNNELSSLGIDINIIDN